MTFAPRTPFGSSYEIVELIGVGGMGEVYRARDRHLGRDVALKILPEANRLDPEALRRVDREARLLASLNHPNIATLHGLETVGDTQALVMELVEGETLDQRIARAPRGRGLTLEDTLEIAKQIAAALDAAHERGVMHRDLKPANIKLRADGTVKVLDFGIAKALSTDASEHRGDTVTGAAAAPVGTPSYMSPEQASGGAVDRRTDIWAFGCVLYEMLTGQRAFEGETNSQILARVIEREPDWSRLPADVPAQIHVLLGQCLEKDARRRRRDAGDLRLDLERATAEPGTERVATSGGLGSARLWIAGTAVAALAALAALAIPAVRHLLETPGPAMRLEISTPPTVVPQHFALSPDGRHIVFVASESSSDPLQHLYLRALDSSEARPIAGTDGARYPFWSPDSRSIGFFASEMLYRIDVAGGAPVPLAPAPNPLGGSWSANGTILFSPTSVSPLFSVPESGGEHVEATELDSPHQKNHRLPSFLPDGRRFLFYTEGEPEVSGIYLGSLDGGAPKRLAAADSAAVSLAPDRVVFVQEGTLVARRLDAARGELTGEPATLASSISADPTGSFGFSASATGVLAYRASGSPLGQLTWFDDTGNVLEVVGRMNGPDLSPDERYVAYDTVTDGNRDVWIMDLRRGGTTRFTTDPAADGYPVWSPNGEQLVFESQRNGTFDLFIAPFSRVGEERLLLGTSDNEIPIDWSGDGLYLLYRNSDADYGSSDLRALPVSGEDRMPVVVANTPFEERMGAFSPDGRWVAYDTDRSGRFEIIVQAFPGPNEEFHVSTDGGVAPQWSADGGEIYFISPDRTMMAVRVATTAAKFEAEKPVPLFATRIGLQAFNQQYAVARDKRFLINNLQADDPPRPITVLLNWKP
ncbi:MAG TPA: protein kinase [Gammaproteobacteria bacterium]